MFKHWLIVLLSYCAMTLGFVQYGAAQIPDSILRGEYFMTLQIGYGEKSEEEYFSRTDYFSMNFAGGGNGTFEMIYSSGGNIESGPFTYSVNDDGTFSINISVYDEDHTFHGIVSSDGERFTMWPFSVGIKKSSGMSNASLSGEYITTAYFTMEYDVSSAAYSSMNFNGDGTGTDEIIFSSSAGDIESAPFTYSVNDDGTFFITFTEDGEDTNLPGIVSSDGESFTIVSTQSDDFGITVGIKKSSGMSNVSLSGEYIMIQYINEEGASFEYISVNFADDGTGTFEVIYSSGGDEGGAGPFTYSVNDDGTFSFTVTENGGGATFPGIVSSDGESFTMVLTKSDEFGIWVGIAKSDFITGIHENYSELPDYYKLKQNYPNPFNPTTTVRYSIPQTDFVQLKVYNVVGELVRTLVREEKSQGNYTAIWDGKNDKGRLVSGGVYFYTLNISGNNVISKQMLLQK